MIVKAVVKPSSGKQSVDGEGELRIMLMSPPEAGKANREALTLVAKHFHVPVSNVRLLSGAKSRKKVFEVDLNCSST